MLHQFLIKIKRSNIFKLTGFHFTKLYSFFLILTRVAYLMCRKTGRLKTSLSSRGFYVWFEKAAFPFIISDSFLSLLILGRENVSLIQYQHIFNRNLTSCSSSNYSSI